MSFQQYYSSYPIMSRPQLQYGVIILELQQGTVSSYERSLMYTEEEQAVKRIVQLPGGDELKAKLAQISSGSAVKDLIPAYIPVLQRDTLRLTPVWRVTLNDGSVLTIS